MPSGRTSEAQAAREAIARSLRPLICAAAGGFAGVAGRCGVSRQTVQKWSTGETSPAPEHWERLAEAVGAASWKDLFPAAILPR